MELALGVVLLAAGFGLLAWVVMPPRIRRSPVSDDPRLAEKGGLARAEQALARATPARMRAAIAEDIELAGSGQSPGRVVGLMLLTGIVLAVAVGVLVVPWLGVLAFFISPIAVRMILRNRADRLRRRFEDQLTDTLQLMASSLRAGNSLLSALDTLAEEAAQPTAREFVRASNEIRVGSDVGDALDAIAERMHSSDFAWVSQAVDIHREVGGNLAEVLDQVGATLRDRNQMRRQVQALSADGRLSAVVLIALPPAVTGLLAVINPQFLTPMFSTPIGWVLLAISAVLFIAGGLWIRRLVTMAV
jgi:tight adherence protein B